MEKGHFPNPAPQFLGCLLGLGDSQLKPVPCWPLEALPEGWELLPLWGALTDNGGNKRNPSCNLSSGQFVLKTGPRGLPAAL